MATESLQNADVLIADDCDKATLHDMPCQTKTCAKILQQFHTLIHAVVSA